MVDQGEKRRIPGLLPSLVWGTVNAGKVQRKRGKEVKGNEISSFTI